MNRFAPLALLSILFVACPQPANKSAPSISFASFVNTVSGVSIPGSSTTLPSNFVAQVKTGDEDKVVDVQCSLDGNKITSSIAYRANCAYAVAGANATLSATATNPSSVSATTTKSVTIDNVAPTASSLQVGSSNFDPATGTSFNTTATLNTTSLLKVTSSDPDVLQTFIELDGKRLAEAAGNTVQYSLSVTNSSPFGLKFGVVDKAGNISRYSVLVSVNEIKGDGIPPVVSINPIIPTTVTGNLTVTVNASDTSGIKSVTLVANNNPVATATPQAGEPSVSFALDTVKFSNGPLELKAIAVDKTDLSTTSNVVNVTISNPQSPVLSIASPTNKAELSGRTVVSVNVLKRGDFTYATTSQCTAASLATDCGSLKVNLIDYRGTIVDTKTVITPAAGITQLFESDGFDLGAIPSDAYTISASTNVLVAGSTVLTKLSDEIGITNKNTSQQPPAIIITNPIRVNELQTILPVFAQSFGFVVVNLTDNTGLASVELRATCDTCASGNGPVNSLEQNILLTGSAADVVLKFDADGTPYLPNGDYTLRVVAQDTSGNRNIQEIKTKINRNPNYIKLVYAAFGVENLSKGFNPSSGTCTVKGLDATKRYRVASWFINPSGVYSFRDDSVTNATEAGIGSAFNAAGNWLCYSQVTNVTDARVDWVSSGFSVVTIQ
jgi:large repetitive protein